MLSYVKLLFIILLFWPMHIFPQIQQIAIGDMVPDLIIKNPEGNEIKLANLRGQLVLLEFWTSWDRYSRQNHPHLVKCYNKYSKKKFVNGNGFSCFSVSLDMHRSDWLRAINLDALVWNYHGCSFNYWSCQHALDFGVQKLPSYFLIDKDGILIQKLSSLENLDKLLVSYLKQK
ncbi:MAG: TlpA family protein disulfide reductase [Bacteroidetes bacterium]|nr:TlpA family protein disulfide reductase [Bacteroidota bacterium]